MSDAPSGQAPPGYAASLPQILVAPLPDAATFFQNASVQGEIFVKGLGDGAERRAVNKLSIRLYLVNRLPAHPDIDLHTFRDETVWPSSAPGSSSTAASSSSEQFPASHRFCVNIPAPSAPAEGAVPGTLNLAESGKGEIKWCLRVTLQLSSGEIYEDVQVEGTPQAIGEDGEDSTSRELESKLDRAGVTARLLTEDPSPRLGTLLRLGVELRPKERQRTGVAGIANQPDSGATLRALRRVRVELYRLVHIVGSPASSSTTSSAPTPMSDGREHLTLLHASGKSLRYPGPNHPPLRVLFTLPTVQLGSTVDQTWGEISMTAPYHTVTFFVRVIFGFGALAEAAPEEMRDFSIEQKITIRPKLWREPRPPHSVVMMGDEGAADGLKGLSEEEVAQELYRRKGRDVVGVLGTFRSTDGDQPPAFDEPGPSHHADAGPSNVAGGLPTFLESEAQAAAEDGSMSARASVQIEDGLAVTAEEEGDPTTRLGGQGSLKGELGTWVEYDGYETFSVAPPSASVSFGASGIMDPPHPDDEDVNVGGGLAARLGLNRSGGVGGMELMEQLGLGEGTRVIDLQDDLPPGIDEPSLPALPTFTQTYSSSRRVMPHPAHPHPPPPHEVSNDISPPSFAASEAQAQADADERADQQGLRRGSLARQGLPPLAPPIQRSGQGGEEPPGYFGQAAGGPPAYS